MSARAVVGLALIFTAACGGAPFSAIDLAHVDASADDDGSTGFDASPEAGQDAPQLIDAGPLDAPADVATPDVAPDAPACTCVDDLSGVGLGDFAIGFTITTTMHPTPPGYGALLNQHATCDSQHAGWDVWLNGGGDDGTVELQVYDGSAVFDSDNTPQSVNDGSPHRVVLARRNAGATMTFYVDGVASTRGVPAEALGGTLAPLLTGTDPVCSANGAQPSEPLVGMLSGVCITAGDCLPL